MAGATLNERMYDEMLIPPSAAKTLDPTSGPLLPRVTVGIDWKELSIPEEEVYDSDDEKDNIGNDQNTNVDVSFTSRRRTIESGIQRPQRWKLKLQRALTPVDEIIEPIQVGSLCVSMSDPLAQPAVASSPGPTVLHGKTDIHQKRRPSGLFSAGAFPTAEKQETQSQSAIS